MAKYKDFDDEIIFDSGSSNPVKSVRSKKKKKDIELETHV